MKELKLQSGLLGSPQVGEPSRQAMLIGNLPQSEVIVFLYQSLILVSSPECRERSTREEDDFTTLERS